MGQFDYKKYIQENRITINNEFDIHAYVKGTVMEDVVNDVIDGYHGPKMKTELRRISSAEQMHEWAKANFPDVVNPDTQVLIGNVDELFESELNEANDEPALITDLRDVVENGYKKVKDPKSGKKMMVDTFSASAITKVYDALNGANKEKFGNLGLMQMQSIAMKLIK